ncbi:UNVERIFIED_ORG: hypothetical protein M2438_001906 [Methylobacterium sp. SuP10 SLI 274]|uniref:hypothetical protein n=1 Tax=Methylorubrum extorquens TaxID=408 RepID=UPI00209D27E9|nr:hypothetical protein [Methylorubrum extorquens]MDF9863119.1 hypothetical protein [Methylorubrum pseudosasae]MDH6636731.1 hypothetical protein [Methylobacterium sp. SuP10 SLI 274]MDH6665908.1 hypothetical protein [Methylorubrum zatmanii]MCP1557822.1 hypothetical protein [Methylorubrum extorquens]MDF9791423.1 hypothetical protein [Methylorubrum extorquens]
MERELSDFSEEKDELRARLDGLEILIVGLYGVLAKHAAIDPDALIDELAEGEHLMRQRNLHSEVLRLLRETREHVSKQAYGRPDVQ